MTDNIAPRTWPAGAKAFSAKQWDELRFWFADNRLEIFGKTVDEVIALCRMKEPKAGDVPLVRCPVRGVDHNAVIETCSALRWMVTPDNKIAGIKAL